MVKQAILNGSDPQQIAYVIKTAAPIGEYLIEDLATDLKKDRIDFNFTDESFEKFANVQINLNSKLAKKVIEFNQEFEECIKTAEELLEIKATTETNSPIEKLAKKGEVEYGTKLASVIKFFLGTPKRALAFTATAYGGGRLHQHNIQNVKKFNATQVRQM